MEARELVVEVAKDEALQQRVREDPVGALAALSGKPLDTDVWIYRVVVTVLGTAILTAMGGAIGLTIGDANIPDLLNTMGSAAIGALAGLLVPSPTQKG